MAKKKDNVSRRLAAIANSSPSPDAVKPIIAKSRDKRSAQRDQVFRAGLVITGRTETIKCVAYDVSSTGVRIRLEGAIALPESLVFKFPQIGISRRARVAWQDGQDAGLEFVFEKK